MNYSQLQELYAGKGLTELFDIVVQNVKIYSDITYELVNSGADLKFNRVAFTDIGVGKYGEAKAGLTGMVSAPITAPMLESLAIATIPYSYTVSAPDKTALVEKQIKSATNWVGLTAISHMFGYVDGDLASANVGFYDSEHDPTNSGTEGELWIDAGGTADTNGLTDAWVIRWADDGAVVGIPVEGETLGVIKMRDPYVTNVLDLNGKALPTTCIPVSMFYAPALKRANACIRIANLNHPLTTNAKVLTEELLLEAIGLLDTTEVGTVSVVCHPTQYTEFLKGLTNKTNLMQVNTDGNINTKVLAYNGCLLRPTQSIIYHSKVVGGGGGGGS